MVEKFSRGQQPPARNALLHILSREDYALIDTWLTPIQLRAGDALYPQESAIETVYFPTGAVIAMLLELAPHRPVEMALIGREGIVGWSAVVGCLTPSHRYVVALGGGTALAIPAERLSSACARSPRLLTTILRFAETLTVQMSFAMASHMCENIDQRLARWILVRHDRSRSEDLVVRHRDISDSLAIRRASVTDALHILEGDRLIRCRRGRLMVRNRPALEQRAGETYRRMPTG